MEVVYDVTVSADEGWSGSGALRPSFRLHLFSSEIHCKKKCGILCSWFWSLLKLEWGQMQAQSPLGSLNFTTTSNFQTLPCCLSFSHREKVLAGGMKADIVWWILWHFWEPEFFVPTKWHYQKSTEEKYILLRPCYTENWEPAALLYSQLQVSWLHIYVPDTHLLLSALYLYTWATESP